MPDDLQLTKRIWFWAQYDGSIEIQFFPLADGTPNVFGPYALTVDLPAEVRAAAQPKGRIVGEVGKIR